MNSFADYVEATATPPLPLLVSEFVQIGIDCVCTHMYDAGTLIHMRLALAAGATKEQIMEVLVLATGIVADSLVTGFRILAEQQSALAVS